MNATDFTKLIKIVGDAEWVFAVEELEDDQEVQGLIIGTPDYVQSVLDCIPENDTTVITKGH